ncbi:MAG: hypothetical protein JSS66_15355 [Armatimonadetes bacterium]|nr:hypothetical protein [Armatimonadota bacterium]
MKGILLVAVLAVRSSFVLNKEEPVGEGQIPDTLQWWITNGGAFRIKTFAVDHDIHIWRIDGDVSVEQALANNQRHYGDVLSRHYRIEIEDATNGELVAGALAAAGLEPMFELEEGAFAYWKPDAGPYENKSGP